VAVLLPLGVALAADPFPEPRSLAADASVALALIAFALMMFQFALVSRLAPASRPFGSDALMQFHREMGIAALAFVLAHPLLLGVEWQDWSPVHGPEATRAGAIALWVCLIVVVSSLARGRLRLGYEAWQAIHLIGACLIVGFTLDHVLSAPRYARAPLMRWTILAYAGLFLALLTRYRVVRPLLLWRRPWEVVANEDVGGNTRLLRVRPTEHPGLTFEPGQFAWLFTGRTPIWSQQHPISIASSAETEDGVLEFAIKALGDWSSTDVPALAPGRRVWVDGAFGGFTPERQPGQGFVFIAGGIGIAPIRSMLLSMRDREDVRPVLLFHAAATWTRVVFREEIERLQAEMNLRVVYVFEQPAGDWTGERGFLTADTIRRHLPRQFRRYQYFVCGPVPMMDSLERILTDVGVPASRVHTERFQMV
jgi:predicted ferric reductase